jgi:hypothetical protein
MSQDAGEHFTHVPFSRSLVTPNRAQENRGSDHEPWLTPQGAQHRLVELPWLPGPGADTRPDPIRQKHERAAPTVKSQAPTRRPARLRFLPMAHLEERGLAIE